MLSTPFWEFLVKPNPDLIDMGWRTFYSLLGVSVPQVTLLHIPKLFPFYSLLGVSSLCMLGMCIELLLSFLLPFGSFIKNMLYYG